MNRDAEGAQVLPDWMKVAWLPAAIVGLGVAIGWLYDLAAKSTPFSVLPFALAFPLLAAWVGMVAGGFPRSLLALFLGGIPLAAAIHLADAIPDVEVDASRGVRTLAVTVGSSTAVWLAAVALVFGGIILAVDAGRLAWLMLIAVALGAVLYLRLRHKWVLIGSAAVAAVGWLA